MSATTLSRSSRRRSGLALARYALHAARTTSDACAALFVTSSTYLWASPTGSWSAANVSSTGFSCANMPRLNICGSTNTSGTCFGALTARVWLSAMFTIMFSRAPEGSRSAAAAAPFEDNENFCALIRRDAVACLGQHWRYLADATEQAEPYAACAEAQHVATRNAGSSQ